MFGFQRLLLGIDGVSAAEDSAELVLPESTRAAAAVAIQVAAASGAELTVVHVADTVPAEYASAIESAAAALVDSVVNDAEQRGVKAEGKVAVGRAWMELTKEVLRCGHQMLVVGSRQQSAALRLLLGSTGNKLLRNCPCPVWIVRPGAGREVSTVVVADDLTEVGSQCVSLGVAAARFLDGRLLVVNAIQYPLAGPMRHTEVPDDQIESYRANLRTEGERAIQEHLSMTDYRTITQGTRAEIIAGRPDLVIEEAISAHSADLLIMGTVARGGVPGLLIGNTAERLLPVIDCSLIAVKPDDFVCPVSLD